MKLITCVIRPEVLPTLRTSPKAAADEVVEIVLRGLPRPTPSPRSRRRT